MQLRVVSLVQLQKQFKLRKNLPAIKISELAHLLASTMEQSQQEVQKQLSKHAIRETITWAEFLNILQTQHDIKSGLSDHALAISQPYTLVEQGVYKPQFLKGTSSYGKRFFVHSLNTLRHGPTTFYVLMFDCPTETGLFVCQVSANKKAAELSVIEARQQDHQAKEELYNIAEERMGARKKIRMGKMSVVQSKFSRRDFRKMVDDKGTRPVVHSRPATGNSITSQNYFVRGTDLQKYMWKERKRIHSAFQAFEVMPAQQSLKFSTKFTNKLNSRTIHQLKGEMGDYQSLDKRPRRGVQLQTQKSSEENGKVKTWARRVSLMRDDHRKLTRQYSRLTKNETVQDEDESGPALMEFSNSKVIGKESKARPAQQKKVVLTGFSSSQKQSLVAVQTVKNEVQVYRFKKDVSRWAFQWQCQIQCRLPIIRSLILTNKINNLINVVVVTAHGTTADHTCMEIHQLDFKGNKYVLQPDLAFRKVFSFACTVHLVSDFLVMTSYTGEVAIVTQQYSASDSYFTVMCSQKYSDFDKALPFSAVSFIDKTQTLILGTLDGRLATISCAKGQLIRTKEVCKSEIKALEYHKVHGVVVMGGKESRGPKKNRGQARGSFVYLVNLPGFEVVHVVKLGPQEAISGLKIDYENDRVLVIGYNILYYSFREDRVEHHTLKRLQKEHTAPQPSKKYCRLRNTGTFILLESVDSEVLIYRASDLQYVTRFYLDIQAEVVAYDIFHDGCVAALAFQNRTLELRNVHSEEVLQVFHDFTVDQLVFLPPHCDFSLLCTKPEGTFTLLQTKLQGTSSRATKSLFYHKATVSCCLLTSQNTFYSGDENNNLFCFILPHFSVKFTIEIKQEWGLKGITGLRIADHLIVQLENNSVYWIDHETGTTLAHHEFPSHKHYKALTFVCLRYVVKVSEKCELQIFDQGKGWKKVSGLRVALKEASPLGIMARGDRQVVLFLEETCAYVVNIITGKATQQLNYPMLSQSKAQSIDYK